MTEDGHPLSSVELPDAERPRLLNDAQFNEAVKGMLDVGDQAVWAVSSAKHGNGINQLLDGSAETYWQSDGIQPHTVALQFKQLTCISAVALSLDYSVDESYTPRKVVVSAGTNPTDFVDVGDAEMDTPKGWILIKCFEDLTVKKDTPRKNPFATCVKLYVQENHQNGRDTHVRGMRIFGPLKQPEYSTPSFMMGAELR